MDLGLRNTLLSFGMMTSLTACNLTVQIKGEGSVTSNDGNINCPAEKCVHNYQSSTEPVILTAKEAPGFQFVSFVDAGTKCLNGSVDSFKTLTCQVRVGAPQTIAVEFNKGRDYCPDDPNDNCLENPFGDTDKDGILNGEEEYGCATDSDVKCATWRRQLEAIIFQVADREPNVGELSGWWYDQLKSASKNCTAVVNDWVWTWNQENPKNTKSKFNYYPICITVDDQDGDGIITGIDVCPLDPTNSCSDAWPFLGERVTLRSANGNYLRAVDGGGKGLRADRSAPSVDEGFVLQDIGNSKVVIKSRTGQYLRANNGGGSSVAFDRNAIGADEQWTLAPIGGGRLGLRCRNGNYLSAENGGGGDINCNRTSMGEWESFTLSKF